MKVSEDVSLLLDDQILNTQQLSFSPFKDAFVDEIDDWQTKIKIARDVLEIWVEVQK